MNDEIKGSTTSPVLQEDTFKTWMCVLCGFIYNEQDGLPEDGIAPGTPWEDVPARLTSS